MNIPPEDFPVELGENSASRFSDILLFAAGFLPMHKIKPSRVTLPRLKGTYGCFQK